jgi:hypothetical protein
MTHQPILAKGFGYDYEQLKFLWVVLNKYLRKLRYPRKTKMSIYV